jgi:LPPG:FO 2-phospho-L-lactate transferase
MYELVGDRLVVIANTGDDVQMYGARVCPDPDLITFHLADRIDPRGWGLLGDTFEAMEQLGDLGGENWFRLGDRDLAIGLDRAARLAAGDRLTQTLASLTEAFGVSARVVPMCDEPVATVIRTVAGPRPFQEFMIVDRAEGVIEGIELDGIGDARPVPEALEALATAEAIVIGPSNPAISIGPILAVPGMKEAITASAAPKIVVSPLVGGNAIKGPTEAFLESSGTSLDSEGIASLYSDIADHLVADSPAASLPTTVTDVLMGDVAGAVRLAAEVLECAKELRA